MTFKYPSSEPCAGSAAFEVRGSKFQSRGCGATFHAHTFPVVLTSSPPSYLCLYVYVAALLPANFPPRSSLHVYLHCHHHHSHYQNDLDAGQLILQHFLLLQHQQSRVWFHGIHFRVFVVSRRSLWHAMGKKLGDTLSHAEFLNSAVSGSPASPRVPRSRASSGTLSPATSFTTVCLSPASQSSLSPRTAREPDSHYDSKRLRVKQRWGSCQRSEASEVITMR